MAQVTKDYAKPWVQNKHKIDLSKTLLSLNSIKMTEVQQIAT